MAYARELAVLLCGVCRSRKATLQIFNSKNARMGEYCSTCGRKRLKELTQEEKQEGERKVTLVSGRI